MADEKKVVELKEKKTLKQKIEEAKAKREERKKAKEVDPEKAEKRKKTLKRVGIGAAAVIGGVITGTLLFGKDDADEVDDEDLETVTDDESEAEAPAEE